MIFHIPSGWKIPQKPFVELIKSKNIKGFLDKNDRLEKVSDTEYKICLQASIDDMSVSENEINLQIDCPMCSDICLIVSKNVVLHFDYVPKPKNIWIIIIFALIGGLILNIMPCVLPVIFMKLRSFAEQDRRGAMFGSILGNYASFIAFALALATLKSAGETIGWGMHFQNIYFLKIVAAALFLLVMHAFEFIAMAPSIRIRNEPRRVFFKNFVSSIVASVIAIPCTAPFLGTAATFAIQGSTLEMFAIFLAMATGFSLPYIAAIFIPMTIPNNLGKFVLIAKKIINYGALATFIWILFLLFNHMDVGLWSIHCILFILCALLFKMRHNVAAAALLVGIFLIPQNISNAKMIRRDDGVWTVYQNLQSVSTAIGDDVIANRIVIFNVSADWCLTCKYNKAKTLGDKKVLAVVKEKNILCIEADITKKNDYIMKFIADHNRIGIPFTIIYGPKARKGIVLPEVPTVNDVLDAIARAM
jgi:suppressor for copper-sensitivity B